MRSKGDRLKYAVSFWLLAYPIGLFIMCLFWIQRFLGLIVVKNFDRFPRWPQRPILVVSNHPSLWEPVMIYGLFLDSIFHPLKYAPWITPDKNNYTDKWYWRWCGTRFISVPRGDRRGEKLSLKRIITILRMGQNVIIFPEGGRTSKGKVFVYSPSGKHCVRELKGGIGHVLCSVDCTVVTIWVDGASKILPEGNIIPRVLAENLTFKIGRPFETHRIANPTKYDHEKAMQKVESALLELADEEG